MPASQHTRRLVELSHVIESGRATYPGLPAPIVDAFMTHESSRAHYASGTEFHLGRIAMAANTGTYIDAPFHRFPGGADIADLPLEALVDLRCVVVRAGGSAADGPPRGRAAMATGGSQRSPGGGSASGRAIDAAVFDGLDIAGRAVLVDTGWSDRWGTPAYFEGHPFLTAAAAERLVAGGAALVGIDSLNIDDTDDPTRPVHSALLAAGIAIVEHMRGLNELPDANARFFAAPVRVRGLGSFPVRAFAIV